MNEPVSACFSIPVHIGENISKTLSQLDSKSLLILGGMTCITTTICIGFICFSGSEFSLSKTGLSITQPNIAS
jgi:hypothetical protein